MMTDDDRKLRDELFAQMDAARADGWPSSPHLWFLRRLLEEAEAERDALFARAPDPADGHNAPCVICGEPCSALAANPSRWPVMLDHAGWRHTGCINKRLRERDALLARLRDPSAWRAGVEVSLEEKE